MRTDIQQQHFSWFRFFSEPVLYLIIWHKKVVILSLQLRPTWLVILPKDVPYDIFFQKKGVHYLLAVV